MRGKFYMAWNHENGQNRTFMFGGAIREDYPDALENERFLELQLSALRTLIENDHAQLGFDGP